jgi:DNA primase catalytic core
MCTVHMSRGIGVEKAQTYFDRDFAAQASLSYYSQKQTQIGVWQGELATELGLVGKVEAQHFKRLADGCDPQARYDPEQLKGWVRETQKILSSETTVAAWIGNDQAWRDLLEEKYLATPDYGTNWLTPAEPYHSQGSAGVPVPTAPPSYTDRQKQLIEMHEIAARLYAENLTTHQAAQDYLASRKVTPDATGEFRLGISDTSGTQLVNALQPYGPELMKASGLFVETESGEFRDRFRGRLMFPIQDTEGKVIAFAGRKLKEEDWGSKYINSPSTEIYDKSRTLYNFHRVKEAAHLVTVEGYLDAMAAHSAGVASVATGGTAFTEEHAQLLGGRRITVNADSDEAGQKAARRQVESLLAQGVVPDVAVLMRKDAAQVIEEDGPDAYRRQIEGAAPVIAWLSSSVRKQHPGPDAYSQADAVHKMIDVLAGATSGLRAELDRQLSHQLGIAPAPRQQQTLKQTVEPVEYVLRTQAGEEVSRVSKHGRYWRRSDDVTQSYSTAASAQKAAWSEAVGQWIEHRETVSQRTGKALQHRAGHDIVFNFDKSVSITGVHDGRVYDAAMKASRAGLEAMQQYAQVRRGGDHPATTTNQWMVAMFPHTTARPERTEIAPGEWIDYSAPHFHVHGFWMNLGRDGEGKMRAVQPRVMFDTQKYGAAVANSVLAMELKKLGYEVQQGTNHAVTIAGYSAEYLKAESPRSEQIKKTVAESGYEGRRAEEVVAHSYRKEKDDRPAEEIQADHLRMAAKYGNEHEKILLAAKLRAEGIEVSSAITRPERPVMTAERALTWAKEKLSTRADVFTERELLTEALWVSQGYVTLPPLEAELKRRAQNEHMFIQGVAAEFMRAPHAMAVNEPGMRYTTLEAKERERLVIALAQAGVGTRQAILSEGTTRSDIHRWFAHLNGGNGLNPEQAQAVLEQGSTQDRVTALIGGAGVGKTKGVMIPIKDLYESAGYEVLAVGPTGRSRREAQEAGIQNTMTLQKLVLVDDAWLHKKKGLDPEKPRLLFVDESSLASSVMMEKLLQSRPKDRIILVGDPRQHESIEAGRIFEELIQAGILTSRVDRIVRQKPDWYLRVVEKLQEGQPSGALDLLQEHGNVHIHQKPAERIRVLAEKYADHPNHTYAVSPSNEGRKQINEAVREVLRERNLLAPDTLTQAPIYVSRQDLTPADLRVAAQYRVGDIIEYQSKNKATGWGRGQYAEVVKRNTDAANPWVEVQLYGKTGPGSTLRYNPETVNKVSVYERQDRTLAVGDKIALKKKWHGLENGDSLRILEIEPNGNVKAQAETKNGKPGQVIPFNIHRMPHWDHGYASTSYSIQGATDEYVLVDVATSDKKTAAAISQAFLYVAGSRGRLGIEFFTDDLNRVKNLLADSKVKDKALSPDEIQALRPTTKATIIPAISPTGPVTMPEPPRVGIRF